jgi:D-aminopeptidase
MRRPPAFRGSRPMTSGAHARRCAERPAEMPNDRLNPVSEAAVQATEEAIVNAMIGAETMTGVDGNTVTALPHDRLREVLKKYNRLQ